MKNKVIKVIAFLLLLGGVVVLALPYISRRVYKVKVDSELEQFEERIAAMSSGGEMGQPFTSATGEAGANQNGDAGEPLNRGADGTSQLDALLTKLKNDNAAMFSEGQKDLKDPFSYSQSSLDLSDYGLQDGILGFVIIPKMDETLPIRLGASDDNMKSGTGHLTETSYPIGGANSNSVLGAHRGYSMALLFKNIDLLEQGDRVYIRNPWGTLTYQVATIKIVTPEQNESIFIEEGHDRLTLLSCHPQFDGQERYVVTCERIK